MKKIKYIIFSFLVCVLGVSITEAASLSVSANKSMVVVGSTVIVTVNASGASGWEYCLNYDTSMYSLTNATSDTGGKCVRTGATLIGYSKVTFTLKAVKSGTSTISIVDAIMYGDDGGVVSSTKGSVTLVSKTQAEIEASYSTNADLKSLQVEGFEITPVFNKNTLEYTLEVPNEVESVSVSAIKADSSATVRGSGDIALTEGTNRVEIIVTAEKGNKKTYVLSITRKELNPITINVDGKTLSVVRKSDVLEAPSYYTGTTVFIDDTEVPAFTSEITGFTLVGLKDEEGTIALYRIENGSYLFYQQVTMDGVVFVPLSAPELLSDYSLSKSVLVQESSVVGYYKEGMDENFVLVYGMNAKTGESQWYQYDFTEGTLQRFQNKEVVQLKEDLKDYFLLVIVFASGLGLSILSIIILLIMNSKGKKKQLKMLTMLEQSKKDCKEEIRQEEKEESIQEKQKKMKKKQKNKKDEETIFLEKPLEEVQEEKGTDTLEDIPLEEQNFKDSSLSKRELRKLEKKKEKELQEVENSYSNLSTDEDVKKPLVAVLEEQKKIKDK